MPIDLSGLPDKQGTQPQLDLSKLPDKAAPTPHSEPTLIDQLGGWRNIGAQGLRALSGILSAEGGITGAGISALGEGAAELLGEGKIDPTRVGVEAGFGAIPFGKVVKGGKYAASALRSGALGAAHTGVSELTQGGAAALNPRDIAESAGFGALGGVIGARFTPAEAAATAAMPPTRPAPVVRQEAGSRVFPVPREAAGVRPQVSVPTAAQAQYAEDTRNALGRMLGKATTPGSDLVSDVDKSVAQAEREASKVRARNFQDAVRSSRAEDAADLAQQRNVEKLTKESKARSTIAQAIQDAGLERKGVSISETTSAPSVSGVSRRTMTTRFGPPDIEEGATELSPAAQQRYDLAKQRELSGEGPKIQDPAPAPSNVVPLQQTPEFENQMAAAQQGLENPAFRTSQEPPPVTEESIARAKAAADAERAAHEAAVQRANADVAAQEARAGFQAVPGGVGAEEARARVASPSSSEQPPTGEAPEPSSLAKFFKSPHDVYSAAYQEPGLTPAAKQQLGVGMKAAAQAQGLPTRPGVANLGKFLESRVAPKLAEDIAAPAARVEGGAPKALSETPVAAPGPESPAPSTTGTSPDWVAKQAAIADAASKDPDFLAAIKKLAKEEKGAVPAALLTHLGLAGIGAGAGGAVGAYTDDEDPVLGALKGAGIGGLLGLWTAPTETLKAGGEVLSSEAGREMLKNLVDVRRASFLASPFPAIKKAVIDPAGTVSEGLTQMLPGSYGDPATGRALVKAGLSQYLKPQNWKDFWQSMGSGADIGQGFSDVYQRGRESPLGFVHLPLEGIQGMTQRVAERAGATPEAVGRITGAGMPETELGKNALRIIQQNKALQLLQPFAKIPIHIAEGARNIPGVAQMVGGEGAGQRATMGGASMALGALEQLYNQEREESGDPVSNVAKVVQSGALGLPYTVPNVVGKALTSYATGGGSDALRELINLFPGGHLAPDQPYPNESSRSYINRNIKRQIEAMLPSLLTDQSGGAIR